jgi:hypothetical protein
LIISEQPVERIARMPARASNLLRDLSTNHLMLSELLYKLGHLLSLKDHVMMPPAYHELLSIG